MMLGRTLYRVPPMPLPTDLEARPVVNPDGTLSGVVGEPYGPETVREEAFAQRQGLRPLYGE